MPTLTQIFEICRTGKIVFADIVKGINDNIQAVELTQDEIVIVNNEFNWKGYQDKQLDIMASQGWLDDNVIDIVKYINETKTIKHIYFTFKTGGWLVDKLNEICQNLQTEVSYCSIFTPTANGFRSSLEAPFQERAWSLTHCWIWNGLNHDIPINKPGYGHLDHEWLRSINVDPNNF